MDTQQFQVMNATMIARYFLLCLKREKQTEEEEPQHRANAFNAMLFW